MGQRKRPECFRLRGEDKRANKRKGRAAAFQAEDRGVRLSLPAPLDTKRNTAIITPCLRHGPETKRRTGAARSWCGGEMRRAAPT